MPYTVYKDVLRGRSDVFYLLIRRPADINGVCILGLAQQCGILLPYYDNCDTEHSNDQQLPVQHGAMLHHKEQGNQDNEPAPGGQLQPAAEHESQDADAGASDIQGIGAQGRKHPEEFCHALRK